MEPIAKAAHSFWAEAAKKRAGGRKLAVFAAVTVAVSGRKHPRSGQEGRRLFSAEALQKFKHILPIVSRILSSAKDFYFWQSPHNACTVNADRER
jgi:hypothetical protein